MKKRVLSVMLALGVVLSLAVPAHAVPPITITVGGKVLETDVDPIIVSDRTMLPVRAVFEAIGAKVDFVAEERKVVAAKKDTVVEFVIDSNVMTINGEAKTIDVPAQIVEDRTLVPVRACAESFDLTVEWNGNTRTVKVRKPVSLISEDSAGKRYEYDANGNETYSVDADGDWEKRIYDENGNEIYCENSFGGWYKYAYDTSGNEISYEDSEGNWRKSEYDENGNPIYYEGSDGSWWN
ncbi:MAG: copper amine oxidase N-terminal domain-containing protein, partial [Clostridia bacterium]|nr:copper amine oxidase N-terminal domain-containing protein [Clostridia bacterium]